MLRVEEAMFQRVRVWKMNESPRSILTWRERVKKGRAFITWWYTLAIVTIIPPCPILISHLVLQSVRGMGQSTSYIDLHNSPIPLLFSYAAPSALTILGFRQAFRQSQLRHRRRLQARSLARATGLSTRHLDQLVGRAYRSPPRVHPASR